MASGSSAHIRDQWLPSAQIRLSAGGPTGAWMELKPVENDRRLLSHNHRFGHAAIDTDAQTDHPQKQRQIPMKRAEDGAEEDDFCDKVSKEERIESVKGRINEQVIMV